MGKRNTDPLPEEVDHLRVEVQAWRRTKAGPGAAMPQELWETAVRLARAFGVCRIARATGLDYVWLRKKVERRVVSAPALTPVSAPTFLEMPTELVMPRQGGAEGLRPEPPAQDGTLIEVAAADGSRMRIQLGSGSLDAAGVVAAFLGRSH